MVKKKRQKTYDPKDLSGIRTKALHTVWQAVNLKNEICGRCIELYHLVTNKQ